MKIGINSPSFEDVALKYKANTRKKKMREVKDKSVPMPNPEINNTGTDEEAITDAGNSSQSNDNLKDWSTFPVARLPSRNTSSKYDFVKVNLVFPFNSLLLC